MLSKPSAVLFDLDGTLIDTADDLAACLNRLLAEESLAHLPHALIRTQVSNGANAMIKLAFGHDLDEQLALSYRNRLLQHYAENIAQHSCWFDGLEAFTHKLKQTGIPWGIVTNKPRLYTDLLLNAMGIDQQVDVVVCPDDLGVAKPDPRPLLHACTQVQADPANAVYVGDHIRDIQAGRAAGMRTVAAAYGYIEAEDNIQLWQADHIVQHGAELTALITP
ncbi:phosphoglycolate phosphatase [Oceanospirillum multiglobuliferum]|uniref:phosphoglycolate phosphatase n=1 Tax=Oceanospirillum multiglobuliferum TaxID=64969 RepID=A0A1T4RQC3_9GAMM|nr:phosphoglycolate phosphatase [Oceanospirillum multiglobuliferum]OPX54686.1 phosphoglycolate phosphatase [Oceanospirillum multiglobuliferum]SKA18199.1 phosphoglycolate phosphatase [Oceanospirillum multiglobuliferum]